MVQYILIHSQADTAVLKFGFVFVLLLIYWGNLLMFLFVMLAILIFNSLIIFVKRQVCLSPYENDIHFYWIF